MTREVFLTATGAFLPFEPVGNDAMEGILGYVGGKPSRARRIVLRANGIRSRHYAINRTTGEPALTNAQMTAAAIGNLGEIGDVDCLATGTSLPDQLMPNHGVMVHGELGWPRLEVVSCAGICLAGTAALKYAWMVVGSGTAQRAVATGSELISPLLHARHFNAETDQKIQALQHNPEHAFEKDFLRWMLSDGAGAVLLECAPRGPVSLRIDWIELSSAAGELPVCMHAGAERDDDARLRGWMRVPPDEWHIRSTFAVQQDIRLLNHNIARATLREPLDRLVRTYQLSPDQIDWFLPHLSSHYFAEQMVESLEAIDFVIPRERWFSNLATKGNTGSAAPYIILDELFRSGRIIPGHRILMFIPESGRFSSGFVYMEAV